MRRAKSIGTQDAFTMVELLVVMAIIGILAALLLPALTGGKKRAARIACEVQLQQIGVAFQSFSHDHNSKFPMQVSLDDGGSMELLETNNVTNGLSAVSYRLVQSLAGTLATPRVLVCPADTRTPALSFNALQNSNVSYFVGVNAQYDLPMSILAGDANLAASSSMLHGPAGGRLTWNSKQHEYKGNVLFSDGHVEEWNDGANSLSSRVDILLPTQGGGSSTHPSASYGANGTSMGGSTSQNSGTNASEAQASVKGQTAPKTSQSNSPGEPSSQPNASSRGQDQIGRNAAGSSELAESISVTGNLANTNLAGVVVSNSSAGASTMSPANRQVASVLRTFLVGTYSLILLLLLLYALYRLRRWQTEVERRRQFKLKLEQMREKYGAQRR